MIERVTKWIDWLLLIGGLGLGLAGMVWTIPAATFVGGGFFALALTGFYDRAHSR